jgi:hypothetical protein
MISLEEMEIRTRPNHPPDGVGAFPSTIFLFARFVIDGLIVQQ